MKNYEKCKYVNELGQMAVYVTPECPNGHLIKGLLATTKQICSKCKSCKRKIEDGNASETSKEKRRNNGKN